ncbi:uncharacterized protein KD926_010932 [Aspergillus affinis]|uniref:uncharacterized protein n=1 Tax=Aspergillus affinis TaxID=1070780 RepID=UPI0022FF2092|nr:uncharacterized protein KD926_010932 [Aspergillus affinis]KAI9038276.1 hypothetical protein KD926_010932 [Aspergillus affinis]
MPPGPIIRINPNKIHIHDPDYFDQVYHQTNGRTNKPPHVAGAFGAYPAIIGTQAHEVHRVRRSAVSPFFSKKNCGNGDVLNMKYMFGAVTLDIINDYAFARDPYYTLQPDFGQKSFDDVDGFLKFSLLKIHIPWLMRFTYSLPDRINKILAPAMADILDFRLSIRQKLHNELCPAIPDPIHPPSLTALEHLPYLSAVIDEGLRLYGPVTHRITIQLPDRALQYHGYSIPANTIIDMTPYRLMRDEAIFAEPQEFSPER